MNTKITLLLAMLSLKVLVALSQQPERILVKKSSNLKEPSEEAKGIYNKGVEHFNKKEYPLAIGYYKYAIALDSDYVDALNNLGLTFYESGQLDSAAWYLKIALRKLPEGTTALQDLGLVEEKKGNFTEALKYYQQISVIEPQNPEGYYNSARVLANMAKLDESLVQAQQAEKLYSKAHNAQLSDCHYLLFVIYFNMRNKPMTKKYRDLCKRENIPIPAEMEADPN